MGIIYLQQNNVHTLIKVKHVIPFLLTLGRDSNRGPIRRITTRTSDAEKRLVTCEKTTGQSRTTAVEKIYF